MEFWLGFVCGSISFWFCVVAFTHQRIQDLKSLERRVDKLYRHLACGQGYVGCSGGPKCSSDHK